MRELTPKDLERLEFSKKWHVFDPKQQQDRKAYIQEAIQFYVSRKIVRDDYFEHPFFIKTLKCISILSPVTYEMMKDFILGAALLFSGKYSSEAEELLKPTMKVLTDYFSSDYVNFNQINKHVGKKNKMLIDGWENINIRKALKEFIKDKPVILGKWNIDSLKMEYKLNQEKKYREIRNELSGTILKGFSCPLDVIIVQEIYYAMAENFIRGDLQDFLAIFSNSSNTVNKPVQWLVLNERGNFAGRGNQTALNEFLKLILGKLSNNDRRKAKDLFIDEQGYFIKESLLKPDKTKISTYEFEIGLKEILKKADH